MKPLFLISSLLLLTINAHADFSYPGYGGKPDYSYQKSSQNYGGSPDYSYQHQQSSGY